MGRLFALTTLLIGCSWPLVARAEHAAAARLEKRITVSFIETPLERAVQEIGRLANVAMVVDAEGLGEKKRRFPVSLQLAKTPAREVLDLISKDATIGYSLDGHVVFVSTRARARAGEIVLKAYDIRDLTYSVSNFPGPDFTLTRHAVQRGMGGPISLEESPPPDSVVQSGSLAELIMSRVRPDEWGAELGTSIEERGGFLNVMQVEEVQDEIVRLLNGLRATESLFIGLESWALLAGPRLIDGALKGTTTPGFLAPDEFARVMRGLLDGGAERLGSARTVCMNNQRVYAITGIVSSYVADLDLTGRVFDPVMGQAFDGFTLDVHPIVSHDRRFVTLSLAVAAPTTSGDFAPRTAIAGSPFPAGEVDEDWSLEKKGDDVRLDKRTTSGAVTPAPARVQELDQTARNVATFVQVPRGHAAVFTVPAVRDMAAIFVVRPTIIGEPGPRRRWP